MAAVRFGRAPLTMLPDAVTRGQLLRYAATGLLSNATLYVAYLLLTSAGLGYKVAMSVVYCAGVLMTFAFNRRWTFSHEGEISFTFVRYVATYALGYVFNLTALFVLVDRAGLPHRWTMAALILVTAGLLFMAQKYWVFASERSRSA